MPPPDPDIDEVAVERAVNGDRHVPLNRAEHHAAWRELERRGKSARQIADTLGATSRTVWRWRAGQATPLSRPPGIRQPRPPVTCPDCSQRLAGNLPRHVRRQHPHDQQRSA